MKKRLKSLFFVIVFLVISTNYKILAEETKELDAIADNNKKIIVNLWEFTPSSQERKQLTPIVYNEITYLPVRSIAEYLGFSVDFIEESKTFVLNEGMYLGERTTNNVKGGVGRGGSWDIKVIMNKDLNIKIDNVNFIPRDDEGNRLYPLMYKGNTYLPAKSLGELLGKEVSWFEKDKCIVIGQPIEPPVFKPEDLVDVNNISELLQLLNKYPYDYGSRYRLRTVIDNNESMIKSQQRRYSKDTIESINSTMYNGVRDFMNGFFGRDYKTIGQEFKNQNMGYFAGWWIYKDEKFHQVSLMDEWVNDTKEYQIVQKSNFITDSKLLFYNDDQLAVRGRWQFKYENHNKPENIKYEIEDDANIEVGQWYEVDMDVLIHSPVSNAPYDSNILKMRSTTNSQVIKNYKYLSEFRKIKEEDVIGFQKYKEKIEDRYKYEICVGDEWAYYCDYNEITINKIKVDGSKIVKVLDDADIDFFVHEGHIYLKAGNSNGIYRININTGEINKLTNKPIRYYRVFKDKIYYLIDNNRSPKLYAMDLDGKNINEICDTQISSFYIEDEKIIYQMEKEIYSIDLDGTNKHLITDNISSIFSVIDGWIYFRHEDGKYYLVKLDGSKLHKRYGW